MSSTPTWMTDATAIQGTNGGVFNTPIDPAVSMLDPSMTFLQNPDAIDLNSFPSGQPVPPRLQNGHVRNASPGFQNSMYQVPSVVPSKRPRTREDGAGGSPAQVAGGLPGTRAQTPHQAQYQPFPPNQPGPQPFPQSAAYPHLQQGGSVDASPSPVMQNQAFRPPSMPQRVQTGSPNSFNPAIPNYGPRMSPGEHASRMTPGHGPQASSFMQAMPYGSPYAQQYPSPASGMSSAPQQGPVPAQQQAMPQQPHNAQRIYQMRLQQQLQQGMAAQNRMPPGQGPPPMNQPGQVPGPQGPPGPQGMGPSRGQPPMVRAANPDQFVKSVVSFMQQRGLPVNTNPTVGNTVVHLANLYSLVVRLGGSRRVTMANQWPMVAANLQLQQFPTAAEELKHHYERNLAPYEEAFLQSQQSQMQQRQKMQQMQQMQAMQGIGPGSPPTQMSPNRPSNAQGQPQPQGPPQAPSQPPHQSPFTPPHPPLPQQSPPQDLSTIPAPQVTPSQAHARAGAHNGVPPGQPAQNVNRMPQNVYAQQQRSVSAREVDSTPPLTQQPMFPTSSPASSIRAGSVTGPGSPPQRVQAQVETETQEASNGHRHYVPKVRSVVPWDGDQTYGGLDIDQLRIYGDKLSFFMPTIPTFPELGVVDIHALIMSLQSGIHGEVRLALDTLATLSAEQRFQLTLQSCEDLIDTLVDCAEIQVDVLAEHAPEMSDDVLIIPYEDIVRGCRLEILSLQDIPVYGTQDYELDQAVKRLICITTIFRNLSFFENNHELLADGRVVTFLSTVVRYLGTRNMLLRTSMNTLDFMKDIIIYLSNLSQAIELPGQEEALCLLHFLLSFAPSPPPRRNGKDVLMFPKFQPSIHRYLPPAVDSLAKLLARDEPNRSFFKALFIADGESEPPYDLLTRTFALAISPVPENPKGNLTPVVEARRPYLMQGMLAAEILANLAPGPETGVARSWLSSEDGFAFSLLRLVCLLSTDRAGPTARHPTARNQPEPEAQPYYSITHRGITVLRRLAEKSQGAASVNETLPHGILPKKESLLGALLTHNIDADMVKQLCEYAGLEA